MQLDEMYRDLLQDCLHDYVGLWRVMKLIYPDIKMEDPVPDWVFRKTLDAVQGMLNSGLFVVGFLKSENQKNEFVESTIPASQTIEYIQEKWNNGKSQPLNVAYACWFQASTEGEKLAHKLGLA